MSTDRVTPVESPRRVATSRDDAGALASAKERPETDARTIRVSLYGCVVEFADNTMVMPRSILGC